MGSPETVQRSSGIRVRTSMFFRNVSLMMRSTSRRTSSTSTCTRRPSTPRAKDSTCWTMSAPRRTLVSSVDRMSRRSGSCSSSLNMPIDHDRREHVVEIVRDAPGQRADALHALRAQELLLELRALRDVGVDDEHGGGAPGLVLHQGPAAFDDQASPVLAHLRELAHPVPVLEELPHGFVEGGGIGLNIAGHHAEGFRGGPAVQALRALVPVGNAVREVADDDRVLRLIK